MFKDWASIPPDPSHHVTIIQHMQYNKITQKHKHKHNESRHSEMGPVRQNPIQRTVRTAHLSVLAKLTNNAITREVYPSRDNQAELAWIVE